MMNNKIVGLLAFIAGAAVGSAVTWKYLNDKFERLVDEEIESVKDAYERTYTSIDSNDEPEPQVEASRLSYEKPDLMEYAAKIRAAGYSNNTEVNNEEAEEEDEDMDNKPYVIAPEEFDTKDGYEAVSLTMFNDGVVTDEWDKPIPEEDYDYLFGSESLNHFGEFEDDSVFVRNDKLKSDYEILKDERNFSDIPRRASMEG